MSSGGARRALITGAASGLGKSLALRFAADGWRVAVCDLDEDRVRQTAAEIDDAGGTGMPMRADVTSEQEIERLAESVSGHWGGLDVLVNNAGIAIAGRTDETSMEEWRRIFEVNFFGVLRTTRIMLPLIVRGGHIINVASFAGIAAAPGLVAYNTTKAAVISFSESLRAELVEKDIGVSVTCPAFFKTRLMETSDAPDDKTRAMVERLMEHSKVTADDVAEQMFASVRTRQFMLIPHLDARWNWRWKRFFPESYFWGLQRMARRASRAGKRKQARRGRDVG
ncbi:MAG: SDR family NAD(P)-dependent oxidoreductase [Gammaproteobacteria bacterium]|nr:SDR family NAD(P)-dependent oxidoreductase [Gammaproteobacteria bacterium]MCZ6762352.1 SDR family NAD(P)-dependent oxidoreductase [Gammaproteobacteria bacterium]MCZ6880527.1 SDR family NAD(P)-dependent oxidoreductase [Gammaproteobacteria bacterium]